MTSELRHSVLLSLLGSERLVEVWWHTPNLAFNSLRPADVDEELVDRYLLQQLNR